jgi:DNA (cytosine-5)-methyltransferase 1
MNIPIPIIDIFAGPGGLGEGFSALRNDGGDPLFKIKLSIEMDEFAHRTLELRAFFRQFIGSNRKTPVDYYEYLAGKITRTELFSRFPQEATLARKEAWLAELGEVPDSEVDKKIQLALGKAATWVLIGGPPCQAYSLVGRSRMRGTDIEKFEKDPRHFLYKEYLRILAEHQPPIFVMENVKGLLSAKLNQQKTFDLILADLCAPLNAINKNTGFPLAYKLFSISTKRKEDSLETQPRDFIVHSEDYGIPQSRHRLIIIGIRDDIYTSTPKILDKKEPVFINNVLDDLPRLRSGLSKKTDSSHEWYQVVTSIKNAEWLSTVESKLQAKIIENAKNIEYNLSRGEAFIQTVANPGQHREWYIDDALKGVCNHETRGHICDDLHRYFFAAVFALVHKRSPTLIDFPTGLLPNHNNVQNALDGSNFNDRFRVQVFGKPSTTVVSHISKDGHYYIHYDPTQCRSLTVREAARLQTFPDNYFFEGNRTQQYHQVGNAVPPLLAYQIAERVHEVLNNIQQE